MSLDAPPLGDRFEVESFLGRGAFGTVFSAWDRESGERVAVKRLDRLDATSRVRFKREFRALSRMRHEGLVALYELHPMGPTYGFSMELLEGRPFVEALRESDDPRGLLAQLADALGALHREGWLHNDLKPANALVTPGGRVVLLDFGLLAPRDGAALRSGTPAYAAPEATASPESDWYAVGTMLFEAWGGRRPYAGRGRHLLLRKRQADAPPLASVADVPPEWAALTDALLQRDPVERRRGRERHLPALVERPASASARRPFVGRAAELAAIRRALRDAPERSVVVELRGPSGIGKSALLEQVTRGLPGPTLQARCNTQETLSAAAMDALVDGLVDLHEGPAADALAPDGEAQRALWAMFPQIGPPPPGPAVDPASARSAATRGLATLLGGLGGRPVLVVDDAQWLDADSTELLRALLARTPLALLTAVRSDLQAAAEPIAPDVSRELGPLADAEVRALVGDGLHGRLDPAAWRSAAGRPFFVLELAKMAEAGARPASTEALLERRLDALGGDRSALLGVLALADRPLEPRLAARALRARRPDASYLEALSALRAERLVEAPGPGAHPSLQIRHELLRRAMRSRLPPGERRSLHAALDDAMTALRVQDPEAQAAHALGAGRTARGRELLCRAGEEAERRFAFRRAARLYAEARAAEPGGSSADGRLHEREGEAWGKAGRGLDAARALEGAIAARRAVGDERGRLALESRRSELLMRCGATEEALRAQRAVLARLGLRWWRRPAQALCSLVAHRVLDRALAHAGLPVAPGLDPLATDVCFGTGLALTNVDPIRGAEFVMRSLVRARAAGDLVRMARAAAFVACYAQNGGRRGAVAMIAEAEELAAAAGDAYASATVLAARCLRAFHGGRHRCAVRLARETAAAYGAVPGAVRERATAELYEVLAESLRGRYARARALTERGLEDAIERGDRFTETSLRTSLPNVIWLVQDDPGRARAECRRAMRGWASRGYHLQHLFDAIARARIALYEDRPGEAQELLATVWERGRRALHLRSPFIRVTLLDLRARALARAVSAGRRGRRALTRARADEAALAREKVAWSRGFACSVAAAVRRAEGRDASRLLQAAEREFARADLDGHAAAARYARTGEPEALRDLGVVSAHRFARVLCSGWE